MPFSTVDVDTIVKTGFGHCHNCHEPLRAMAMTTSLWALLCMRDCDGLQRLRTMLDPDILRTMLDPEEEMLCVDIDILLSALTMEAEDAMERAEYYTQDSEKENAILEFTNAINVVNFTASLTSEIGLDFYEFMTYF